MANKGRRVGGSTVNYLAGAAVITQEVHTSARDTVMQCACETLSCCRSHGHYVNKLERKGKVYTHVPTHLPSKLPNPRDNFVNEAALRQCIMRFVH